MPMTMELNSMALPSQARPAPMPLPAATFSNFIAAPSPHRNAGHPDTRAMDRRVGGDVKRLPVGPAESHVGAVLGKAHAAQQFALGVDHVDAAGAGAIDIAFGVDLHAVGDAGLRAGQLVE